MTTPPELPCPCGSGTAESACCAPILAGAPARTALALMRSRYVAYVRGAIDHVIESHDPKTRDGLDREATTRWSRETEWLGLEIVGTERGGAEDTDGLVEFIVRGRTGGRPFHQRERSHFRKEEGRWLYVDSEPEASREPVRRVEVPGRNDPCSCGSGQKYKKCHGR